MRIALAQINTILGAFEKNAAKIIAEIKRAHERNCQLVIFPESTLFGYHPFDLLERKNLIKKQLRLLRTIEKSMPVKMTAIVGVITLNPNVRGKPYFNSAAVLQKGRKARFYHKHLLPTGDVFDEARFIQSGNVADNIIRIENKNVLITICEDIWAWPGKQKKSAYLENPILKIKEKIDLVINLSASPFYPGKLKVRQEIVKKVAKHFKAPTVYVNMVGAQDEIIFDGGSFAIDRNAKILLQSVQFEEDLNILDLHKKIGGFRQQKLSRTEELRQALILGIRDYCLKTKLGKVHLGLSGGIDSAVVACLAADALGPNNVKCLALPGPFNAPMSLQLAQQLAKNLNLELIHFPIQKSFEFLRTEIDVLLGVKDFGIVHENLQARIRGLILMSYANLNNSVLLSTGNKSEYATGYTTLYGDMCGGLVPIGDLTKKQVYDLANLYNIERELIPGKIITRPPSAELRPQQKDQDTLPDYKLLDRSVENIVENSKSAKSATDRWLLEVLLKTEFKRWQAPPILKVSQHSFGRGRRLPIAHQAQEI